MADSNNAGNGGGEKSRGKKWWLWLLVILTPIFMLSAACLFIFLVGFVSMDSQQLLTGEAVGLIRVEGVITTGDPEGSPYSVAGGNAYSGQIVGFLEEAEADSSIKAVVLRVDSPGGGVVASDEIYQQIRDMEKPVVISMGEVAASGGYYISAGADEIICNPNTLTGSIGVITQFINVDDFLDEYGIEAVVLTSGEFKDAGGLFSEMTEADREIWQNIIDDAYQSFVGVIVEGRGLGREQVMEVADGRVLSGKQAREAGLVDSFGTLDIAIQRAGELGGIEGEPSVYEYRAPATFFETFLGSTAQLDPVEQLRDLTGLHATTRLMYLYVP